MPAKGLHAPVSAVGGFHVLGRLPFDKTEVRCGNKGHGPECGTGHDLAISAMAQADPLGIDPRLIAYPAAMTASVYQDWFRHRLLCPR